MAANTNTTVITSNKIDIHCHIVPGVDDGAQNIEKSLELLQKAKEVGINKIICTSHFLYDNEHYNKRFKEVYRVAKGFGIKLYKGNEILLNSSTVDEIINGRVETLNGTRYVLIELKRKNNLSFTEICNYFDELIENGFKIIMAHPEQTEKTFKKIDKLLKLRDLGILFQIDAPSFYTRFIYKRRIKKMLKYDLVDFVATDVHKRVENYDCFNKLYKYIEKKYGKKKAEKIFYENPSKVIDGKDI